MDHRHRTTPSSKNYNMLLPTNDNPKCATYVRKSLGLQPLIHKRHGNSILSIIVHINKQLMEITDIYAPTKTKAPSFLKDNTPMPKAYVVRDFNTHHPSWYAEHSESCNDSIRNSATTATATTPWMDHFGFSLLNQPGTFTQFPKNGMGPSIVNLNFPSGQAVTMAQGWHCNPRSGGD